MTETIRQLSEKEKVRNKISVWLGASNHIAVMHTVRELIGNSADEINKGNGDTIKVTLHGEKTITIEDNCKGLPFEGVNDNGTENYKLLTQQLFAGTKYDNGIENDNYTVGTNGVFLTVLTFSSEEVEYTIGRPDGKSYHVAFKKGNEVSSFKSIGKTDSTFTRIKYTLDDDIYEENYFGVDELKDIASEQASLIDGKIIFINEMTGEEIEYKYENGISEYLEDKISGFKKTSDTIVFDKDVTETAKQEGKDVSDNMKVSIALSYTQEDEDTTQIEFLNGSNLIHHGTIYEGLTTGLRTVINRYLRENSMYKKNEKQVSRDDILVGLNYVVDFKSYFPIYANQTKFASYVKYYEPTMRAVIEEFFESFAIENKFEMDRIANQILVNKRSREQAEKTRLDVRKKLQSDTSNNISNRIDGFVNCKSKDNEKTELYIVEGKSALGATKQGRDANIQAILALRGKILNCLKADYNRIFKDETIVNLIKLLGCGVEIKSKHNKELSTFDIDKLRWSKVIITTDADVDGNHIRTLILTAIHVLMPELIEQGKVFIAESPLYEIENNDNVQFAYSDEEKDKIVSKLKGRVNIQRSKGLGENTAEMMWDTTMNPETRKLIKICPEDAEAMKNSFDLFLGDNLAGRKEFIEDNLHKYIAEPLD